LGLGETFLCIEEDKDGVRLAVSAGCGDGFGSAGLTPELVASLGAFVMKAIQILEDREKNGCSCS
jgi:hypothetical protein